MPEVFLDGRGHPLGVAPPALPLPMPGALVGAEGAPAVALRRHGLRSVSSCSTRAARNRGLASFTLPGRVISMSLAICNKPLLVGGFHITSYSPSIQGARVAPSASLDTPNLPKVLADTPNSRLSWLLRHGFTIPSLRMPNSGFAQWQTA